jgi:hypothetical protein
MSKLSDPIRHGDHVINWLISCLHLSGQYPDDLGIKTVAFFKQFAPGSKLCHALAAGAFAAPC